MGWEGNIGLSPGQLRTCPSILQSVSPYHISTIKQQVKNLEHGTLGHAMAPRPYD